MASFKFIAYKNIVLGVVFILFALIFVKDHFSSEARYLDGLNLLQESGIETKATITNLAELGQGEKTLKYTYMVKGEIYRGTYTLGKELNTVEFVAPVTYNLSQPKVHQYNLLGTLERAEKEGRSGLGWEFLYLPISALMVFYFGFNDLRKMRNGARAQEADEG